MLKTNDSINIFLEKQNHCLTNLSTQLDIIVKITDILIKTRDKGAQVFTMGNGGSASTASHFVSDLLKTSITKENKRFAAVSLADNIPVMLAWSNDTSYEDIFVEQLKNFLKNGDVVIGFSGSGKSKNVVKAMEYARNNGAVCVGLTGMSGGSFPKICDICLIVPSDDMLIIESTHVVICHCITDAIRNTGKPLFTYG